MLRICVVLEITKESVPHAPTLARHFAISEACIHHLCIGHAAPPLVGDSFMEREAHLKDEQHLPFLALRFASVSLDLLQCLQNLVRLAGIHYGNVDYDSRNHKQAPNGSEGIMLHQKPPRRSGNFERLTGS